MKRVSCFTLAAALAALPGMGFQEQAPETAPESAARRIYRFQQGRPVDLGLTCSSDLVSELALPCSMRSPCPLYLDLVGADSSGLRIFVSGNIHTGSRTFASLLLASDDNGKTWYEAFEPIAGAGLEEIQFADLQYGWVAGQIQDSPPRDPFFLITTDGGKTWRKKPIYDEPVIGSIEEFWFTSKDEGWLLLDLGRSEESGLRWRRLYTATGGQSWLTREAVATRPAALRPKDLSTLPFWRLRPEERVRAWVLERRIRAEAWETVAAFQISAGVCAPE